MSSSVVAAQDMDDLSEALENANENKRLLVLEFIGSVSYRSTCEFMKPIVDSVATTYKNKADFCTVDVDNNNEFKHLAKAFTVQAMPTFVMIKDYEIVKLIVAPDKQELIKSIRLLIENQK